MENLRNHQASSLANVEYFSYLRLDMNTKCFSIVIALIDMITGNKKFTIQFKSIIIINGFNSADLPNQINPLLQKC